MKPIEAAITVLKEKHFNEINLSVVEKVAECDGKTLKDFILSKWPAGWEDWDNDTTYPVWDKVYEIRYREKEFIAAARELSIGIIQGLPGFGTILFYEDKIKIYERFWIPLYLKAFPFLVERTKDLEIFEF